MRRKTLALVVRCVDYANTSQVVTLYTRRWGLVRGIAKGVHRAANAAFSGPFDLGALYEVVYAPRRPPAMGVLTESFVVEAFRGLRADLDRHAAALCVLEILGSVGAEEQGQPPLFDLAWGTLAAIDTADPRIPLQVFLARALDRLGLMPRLDRCADCGVPPGPGRAVRFSLRLGGVLCPDCRGKDEGARPVPRRILKLWTALASSGLRRTERIRIPESDGRALGGLLERTWIFLLERPVRALQYLEWSAKT